MRTDLFDFELPESNIALRPVSPRDAARMLVVTPGEALADAAVRDLPRYLKAGDQLVVNDTKVIPAQLEGTRTRGDAVARIGATLHLKAGDDRWWAFVRPAKKLVVGDRVRFRAEEGTAAGETCLLGTLDATVAEKRETGEVLLAFDLAGPDLDQAIAAVGHIPLPPYIAQKRGEDAADRDDYQTIYAQKEGAVAAPTAGLHFTPELMAAIDARGIERHLVTLHVGAGTFLPVKADDTDDHKMHAEWGEIAPDTAERLNAARADGRRVIAVGTTVLRLLESAADESGTIQPFAADTDIFITPGYRFRAIDGLMTNFHLPKSTLFMLVSALMGRERMLAAYNHAIENRYRFYSYGDSSLLIP